MNPAFRSPLFWDAYLTLEVQDESADEWSAQLDNLGADFVVYGGTQGMETVVQFPFACGDRYSIAVDYAPYGGSRELYLADAGTGETHRMGWYDLVRWHPYCLRADELDALLRFWERHDARWPEPHVPLLLLCQFVGLEDSAAVKALSARAAAAWRALGLPPAKKGHPPVRLDVPETKDYRWERDAGLGWVFTSDEYCCYSVRNRAHAGGEEAEFPFMEFARMLEHVRRRNEQDGKGG